MIARSTPAIETRATELALTPRQAEAADLVARYQAVAGERPSYSWLARRMNVSRTRAFHLVSRVEKLVTPRSR